VLFFGVFAPFTQAPLGGGVAYFSFSCDGAIVLFLALISFVFVLCRLYVPLWFNGIGALVVVGFSFLTVMVDVDQAKVDAMYSPFGEALAESVSFSWGFPILVIGGGLLIAAAAIPMRGR
jgi:hypothetical protein